MNDVLHYKGYYASIHFCAQENIFFGKITGIEELILFDARSLKDLKAAFLESVETYISDGNGLTKNNHEAGDHTDTNNKI